MPEQFLGGAVNVSDTPSPITPEPKEASFLDGAVNLSEGVSEFTNLLDVKVENRESMERRSAIARDFTSPQAADVLRSQGIQGFDTALHLSRNVDTAFELVLNRVPDRETKIQFYANKLGLDRQFVEDNFDRVEQDVLYLDQRDVIKNAPRLMEWLSNPDNMAKSKDSLRHLAVLEGLLQSRYGNMVNPIRKGEFWESVPNPLKMLSPGQGLVEAWRVLEKRGGRLPTAVKNFGHSTASGFAGAARMVNEVLAEKERYYGDKDADTGVLDFAAGYWADVAKRHSQSIVPFTDEVSGAETLAYDVGTMGIQIGTAIGAGAVSPAIPAALIGTMMGGGVYQDLREKDVSVGRAAIAGEVVGVVGGLMEEMQIGSITSMAGLQGIRRAAVREVMLTGLTNVAQETGQGVLTEAATIAGEMENRDITLAEAGGRLGQATTQGLYEGALVAVTGLVFSAPHLASSYKMYHRSQSQSAAIQEAGKVLAEMPMSKRSSEDTAEVLEGITYNQKAKIDPVAVDRYFETAYAEDKISGESVKQDLLSKLKIDGATWNAALAGEAEVEFSVADWLTHVQNTTDGVELFNHLRVGENNTPVENIILQDKLVKDTEAVFAILDEAASKDNILPEELVTFRKALMEKGGYSAMDADHILSIPKAAYAFAERQGIEIPQRLRNMVLVKDGEELVLSGVQESQDPKTLYQAKEGDDNRASITFADTQTLVTIFKGADKTSVLHEMGHLFVELITDTVKSGKANDVIQQMHDTILEYADGELNEQGIEKITTTWEEYLWQGTAPSAKLARAFKQFRKWFTQVYRNIKSLIDGEIPDDVKDVFDHWLASDDEIQSAQAYYATATAMADAFEAESSNVEKVKRDELEAARARVKEDTDNQLENQTAERVAAWVKATGGRKAIRKQAIDEINKMPVYAAMREIKNAEGLNAEDIQIEYGEGVVEAIQRKHGKIMFSDLSVLDPEKIAKAHGFENAAKMITAFVNAETHREAVNVARDKILNEKHKDFMQELQKRESRPGDKAMHSEANLDFLLADLAVMEHKLNVFRRVEKQALKDQARELLSTRKTIREAMRYDVWANAEARYASQAVAAAGRLDMEATYKSRKKQIYYFTMAQEAFRIREEVGRIERRYKSSKLKMNTVENEYRNAVLDIVNTYKLNATTKAPLGAKERALLLPDSGLHKELDADLLNVLPDFANEIPDWMLTKSKPEKFINFKDLTYDQLQDVDNALKFLIKRGRGELSALKTETALTTADLVAEQIRTMETLPDHKVISDKTTKGKVKSAIDKTSAMLTQMQFLFEYIDGSPLSRGEASGSAHGVFRKAGQAEDAFAKRLRELTYGNENFKGLKDSFELISKDIVAIQEQWGKKFTIKDVPVPEALVNARGYMTWDANMLVATLLNLGNDANRAALMHSDYKFTEVQLQKLASLITADGWRGIQQLWDTISSLYPDLNDVMFRLTNREIPKEPATPFTVQTADGQVISLRGGYYPMFFDPKISLQVAEWKDTQNVIERMRQEAVYRTSAKPRSGMTKARIRDEETGEYLGTKPPLLDVTGVLMRHLKDTTRLITHAEVLTELDMLTRNKAWQATFIKKFGTDMYASLRSWINYQARPEKKPTDFLSKTLDKWRGLAVVGGLGYKTITGVKQRLSLFSAIRFMNKAGDGTGLKYLVDGMKAVGFVSTVSGIQAQETLDAVHGASPYMSSRALNFDREIREFTKEYAPKLATKLKLKGKDIDLALLQEAAFWWLRTNDAAAVYPAWIGARNQALAERLNGITEGMDGAIANNLAAEYADTCIQMSQPSVRPADLAGLQRVEGMYRAFTMMLSWRIKIGNISMGQVRAVKAGQISKADVAKHFFTEWVLPAWAMLVIPALLYDDDEKPEWKDFVLNPMEDAVSWLPAVGETIRVTKYGDMATEMPMLKGLKYMGKSLDEMSDGELEKAGQDALRTILWFAGVPVENIYLDAKKLYRKTDGKKKKRGKK